MGYPYRFYSNWSNHSWFKPYDFGCVVSNAYYFRPQKEALEKVFRGLWVCASEWCKLVRETAVVLPVLEIKPLKLLNQIRRRLDRKLPAWGANRWRSLT